jgi:SAM-dependent methyltransferase
MDDFDVLLAEAESVPLQGWDFSWFAGRATEQRPSWGYADQAADRLSRATAALDVQTGGGEVFAYALGTARPRRPSMLVAVEAWPPNVGVAARSLAPFGVRVVAADRIPFRDGSFDLVTSRHPVSTPWDEITRVLHPGGIFLSQQIGAGSNRELSEAMMGPLPPAERQPPIATAVQAAGLEVLQIRAERLRAEFYDVAAVAHFLRKVIWTVPGFEIAKYRGQLRAVHDEIAAKGRFVSYAQRVLIEARK